MTNDRPSAPTTTDRRKRLGRQAAVGLAVSALAFVPLGAAVASTGGGSESGRQACAVEALPLPDNIHGGNVTGTDPTGSYVVGNALDKYALAGLLWTDDEVKVLTGPPSTEDHNAYDVNSSGLVVGTSVDEDGNTVAWTYDSATDQHKVLAAPGGSQLVHPTAINDAGDIVGYSMNGDRVRPLIWSADEPNAFSVLEPVGSDTRPSGISEDGAIVGNNASPEGGATYWDDADSHGELLVSLVGGVDPESKVYDISNNGAWSAGDNTPVDERVGVLWDLSASTVMEKDVSSLERVNSQGDGVSGPRIIRADDSTVELPALSDEGDGLFTVTELFDRDAQLTAAGSAYNADNENQPVVWTGC